MESSNSSKNTSKNSGTNPSDIHSGGSSSSSSLKNSSALSSSLTNIISSNSIILLEEEKGVKWKLGEGAFGAVYKGKMGNLTVALKEQKSLDDSFDKELVLR